MRRTWIALLATTTGCIPLFGQTPKQTEQSARQALIEMFVGKGENDFARHLPDPARAALIHKGETPETSVLLRISGAIRGLAAEGEGLETFETGPNILVTENVSNHERVEIAVEHDSFSGEEDEIELSLHVYKDAAPEPLPVIPRLIFTLKQESEVWRVTELTVAAHVPLEDPDYLKGLRKQQDEVNESAAQARITMIAQAETNYATHHSEAGYACTFESLYPEGESNAWFTKDDMNAYHFALNGCSGKPAAKYRLTAVPIDSDSEMKSFCIDQSGTLKSATAADNSTCFTKGKFVMLIGAPSADQGPTD